MKTTQKQKAYNHIRSKLMRGELEPGARLSNRGLAKEIGISFIPVREAISQLASEGLVEHRPGDGTFVLAPRELDMAELYDLRIALECHAAVKMAGKMTDADLKEMAALNEQLRRTVKAFDSEGRTPALMDAWLLGDANFHLVLLRATGNRRLVRTVTELRMMSYMFGLRLVFWPQSELLRTLEEHDQLVKALRKGDATGAHHLMAQHILHGAAAVLSEFEERLAAVTRGGGFQLEYPATLNEMLSRLDAQPDQETPGADS